MPGWHWWWKICYETLELDLQKQLLLAQVKQYSFMGDVPWGEGLKVAEARDAAFLITDSGTWVGKPAYLTTDPMTLLEGRRAITHAISDQRAKARGPGCPRVNLLAQQPFRFDVSRTPPPKGLQAQRDSDGMTPKWPTQGRGHNRRRRDQKTEITQDSFPFARSRF